MKKVTKIEAIESTSVQRKIRVAAYARVSTSTPEQLESLETQIQHFEDLFSSHSDWHMVGIYVDEGISGTNLADRQELQRLLEDARAGKIDLILTKSISRFSRNIEECLAIIRELSKLEVAIHFDKENLNTQTMDGELLLSILGSLAEAESKSISDNTKWGRIKRIEQGSYRYSCPPYGYDFIDGQLKINEEEAEIVQKIFRWYLQGEGTYRIAKNLIKAGISTPRDKTWREGTVQYILMNEVYVGDFIYQKTYTDSQYKRHINDGDVEKYYIPDNHEAIITRNDFERVQSLLSERGKNVTKTANQTYPFTQKIKCGHCGGTFIRRTHYSSNQTSYIAWCCGTHLSDIKQCPMKFVKETEIQEALMILFNKLIFGRREIIERTLERLDEPTSIDERAVDEIENQLQTCQAKKQRLAELLNSQLIEMTFYQAEMNRLEAEKKVWLQRKENLLRKDVNKLETVTALKHTNQFLKEAEYYQHFEAKLVNDFIDEIEIESRTVFHFHLVGGLVLTERRENSESVLWLSDESG
ncbi:recombinase family protein [Hutsoniella sourekii]|uniref:recombinase family protein n=1 Tax=Hutsoniella sourekii TaxID=87650 RepID=UPI0004862F42|nr:recombinase family protein [Hutsoniella sourekii]